MFFNSLAKQKSSTLIEAISAIGRTILLYLIIAGKRRMQTSSTVFDISESNFTNNRISVKWLKYFIKYTNSSLTALKKLLLYNSYRSHNTEEFKELACDNNIVLYMLYSRWM